MTINMKDLDVVLEEEFGKTDIEEFHKNYERGFYNSLGTDYDYWGLHRRNGLPLLWNRGKMQS